MKRMWKDKKEEVSQRNLDVKVDQDQKFLLSYCQATAGQASGRTMGWAVALALRKAVNLEHEK